MKAIVLGASGAVGSCLTRALLASPAWEGTLCLVRKPTDLFGAEPKLAQRVVDMEGLEGQDCGADAAFCTIGIGQPRKAAPGEFRKVEFDTSRWHFASRPRKKRELRQVLLLMGETAVGSPMLQIQVPLCGLLKGEIEEALRALGFERLSIFRPSLLVTPQLRYGLQDALTQALFPWISPLLPARFHQIRVEDLGSAMALNAANPMGPEILHYPDCMRILGKA